MWDFPHLTLFLWTISMLVHVSEAYLFSLQNSIVWICQSFSILLLGDMWVVSSTRPLWILLLWHAWCMFINTHTHTSSECTWKWNGWFSWYGYIYLALQIMPNSLPMGSCQCTITSAVWDLGFFQILIKSMYFQSCSFQPLWWIWTCILICIL